MNNEAFFASVRASLFGNTLSQSQVNGLNVLLAAWTADGDGDKRKLAYILATAKHETADTIQPITEYGSAAYLQSKPYWPFVGRGYVQLTWKAGYENAGAKLHVDLLNRPELALQPDIAAKIIIRGMSEGWFTGKKLSDYIGNSCAFVGARAIVNGTDRAVLIAGYAIEFLNALNKVDAPTAVPAEPKPAPQPFPPLPRPIPIPSAKTPPAVHPAVPTTIGGLVLGGIAAYAAGGPWPWIAAGVVAVALAAGAYIFIIRNKGKTK